MEGENSGGPAGVSIRFRVCAVVTEAQVANDLFKRLGLNVDFTVLD
jgi:hypothetical protein